MRTTNNNFYIVFLSLLIFFVPCFAYAQIEKITVTSKGSGSTNEDALSAAYVDAVNQAIVKTLGRFAAERDKQFIHDEVLPNAKEYITESKIVEYSTNNGDQTVTINAIVDFGRIRQKISMASATAPTPIKNVEPSLAAVPENVGESIPEDIEHIQPLSQSQLPQPSSEQKAQPHGLVQIHSTPDPQQPQQTPSAIQVKDQTSEDIVKVTARGVGTSISEALTDAYNNAIQQAIGLYVDAETIVKNDQIIKDQILTHSRGMIKNFDIVDEDVSGGLTRVTILAEVEKQPLIEKVKPFTHSVAQVDGKSLHAQVVTEKQQAEDAQALLDDALKPFLNVNNFFNFTLHGEPKLDEKDKSKLIVTVLATAKKDAFYSQTNDLIEVLKQISIEAKLNQNFSVNQTDNDGVNIINLTRNVYESSFFVNIWQSNNGLQTRWNIFFLNKNIKFLEKMCSEVISISIYDGDHNLLAIGEEELCQQFSDDKFAYHEADYRKFALLTPHIISISGTTPVLISRSRLYHVFIDVDNNVLSNMKNILIEVY